jgi:uncharacterized linocin/CFP29 family protein
MDLIMNGQAHGSVASRLLQNGFDVSALRPYIGNDGRSYISQNINGQPTSIPVVNSNATLRRDEWIQIDQAVVIAARERLRLIADLRGSGLTYNLPNGMGKTVLVSQRMGDITSAIVSMDPARKSEGDRPEFDMINLPLPVIHKDFHFSARQIATSRNSGQSIDVTTAQLAARRVAEEAEKLALGVSGSFTYGGGTVYGLTNFPGRTTTTVTHPTQSNWNGALFVDQMLAMRQLSTNQFYFGPWVLYVSPNWDQFLDDDYSTLKGDLTLRQRVLQIQGIQDVRTLDFLSGYQVILVQQTSDVIRLVMGMDITTLQWETDGGMMLHFKIMAIMVPQIREDIQGQTGLIHAVAA